METRATEPNDNLHFVFPDGLLAYDCVTCGAKCCRGYNTTIDGASELVPLLAHKPELAPYVFREPGFKDEYAMLTFNPACALLDEDNLCTVETDLGRNTKPVTCRLFPVDRISTIGDHVFVDVHFLCPLGLQAYGGATTTVIDHASIRRDLAEVRAGDVFARREPVTSDLAHLVDVLVAIEADLRAEVEAAFAGGALHACLERFCARLRVRAAAHGLDLDLGPAPDAERASHTLAALDRFYGTRRAPLPADAELRLRRNLLGLLCSVHHKYLIRRRITTLPELLAESHAIATTMMGIEYLYRGIVHLNPRRNTVDTLSDIVVRNAQTAQLLSNVLRQPRLLELTGVRLNVPFGFKRTASSFVDRLHRSNGGAPPLGELLASLEVPQTERGTLVRWLSTTVGSLFDFRPEA